MTRKTKIPTVSTSAFHSTCLFYFIVTVVLNSRLYRSRAANHVHTRVLCPLPTELLLEANWTILILEILIHKRVPLLEKKREKIFDQVHSI